MFPAAPEGDISGASQAGDQSLRSTRCTRCENRNCNTGGSTFTPIRGPALTDIFHKFLADQSGATAIEYGLIAAGIALAIITAVNGLGSTLNTTFSNVNTS